MSVFVIAEIGINHNGDINLAKQMIDNSVDAGADAVKFQKRDIDMVYSREFLESHFRYQQAIEESVVIIYGKIINIIICDLE